MSAERRKEQVSSLAALAAAVDLVEIRPIGFLARLIRNAPPLGTPIAVSVKNPLEVKREGDTGFVVHADFSLALHPEVEPKEEFLKLRYTVIGRYRVPPDQPLEQEVLDFFARTNGMVHLWPYLRAFVASSCAQMGITPITLPPFRVHQPVKKPAKKPPPATN
jgi:preprotein translocase subunit SecB